VAAVSHNFGKGRTLLLGPHPSIHCHKVKGGINTAYFLEAFNFAQREQMVSSSNHLVQARLHKNASRHYLWIVNPERKAQETRIRIGAGQGKMHFIDSHWNEFRPQIKDNQFEAHIPGRDVQILEFERKGK